MSTAFPKTQSVEDAVYLLQNGVLCHPNCVVPLDRRLISQHTDASTCFQCKQPFHSAAEGVHAIGRDWHDLCFECNICGDLIYQNEVYQIDDPESDDPKPRHRTCHSAVPVPVSTVKDVCCKCSKPFTLEDDGLTALGQDWHKACFSCGACGHLLSGNYVSDDTHTIPYHAKCRPKRITPEEEAHIHPTDVARDSTVAGDIASKRSQLEGVKCNKCKVELDEDSDAITALGRDWHLHCFLCATCSKPCDGGFIVLAHKPLTPYHPTCLTCRLCSKPFQRQERVCEKWEQAWHFDCLEAMEKKEAELEFIADEELRAEKCDGCHLAIKGKRLTAIGGKWHFGCFVCAYCKEILQPGVEFEEAEGKPWHPGCLDGLESLEEAAEDAEVGDETNSSAPLCAECQTPIQGKRLNILNKKWHHHCFKCFKCQKIMTKEENCVQQDNRPWHQECLIQFDLEMEAIEDIGYQAEMDREAPLCGGCEKPTVGPRLTLMGRKWHPSCLRCSYCKDVFKPGDKFESAEGKPWHPECLDSLHTFEEDRLVEYHERVAPNCRGCGLPTPNGDRTRAVGFTWHKKCLVCIQCKQDFSNTAEIREHMGHPYHDSCLDAIESNERILLREERFVAAARPCSACARPVMGTPLVAGGIIWHPDCYVCAWCGKKLAPYDPVDVEEGKPWHTACKVILSRMEYEAKKANIKKPSKNPSDGQEWV